MKLRKILAVVLAMALLCATFAACGNDAGTSTSSGTTSSTSSSGESKTETASTGDVTLNLRNAMEPTSLNTLLATYAYDFQVINALYECLYELDENDVPQPAAAESVDISEDKLVYTFHLRQDGTWSNGDPVTANDFAFAWQQALTPEVASNYAYMLFFIHNAEPFLKGEVTWEEVGVKVIDDYTLEVTLDNPLPYANNLFSFKTLAPINQKFYEEVGADMYNTDPQYFCTNGAYTMESWNHNSEMVVKKRADYHGADAITVDQINYKIITDVQAGLNSYMSGEIDYTDLTTGDAVQQAEAAGYTVGSMTPGTSFYLMCNTNNEYLSNVNLRRALALSFDKQALIDAVFKNANQPMTGFTPPSVMGANESSFQEARLEAMGELAPATGDLEAAKGYLETALSELGCTVEDLSANLSIDCGDSASTQTEAAFYQEQWRQNLGIEVTINPMQTKQVSENRNNGNFVMSIAGWSPDYNDPMTFLDLWVTGGGNNQTGWGNEEYDSLIEQATNELDVEARQEMFYRCEEILFEEYPILPTYWRADSYSYNTDKIVGGERITTFQTKFFWADVVE